MVLQADRVHGYRRIENASFDGGLVLLDRDAELIELQRLDPTLSRLRRRLIADRLGRSMRRSNPATEVERLYGDNGVRHVVIRTPASDRGEYEQRLAHLLPVSAEVESAVSALARRGPHGRDAAFYVARHGSIVHHLYCRGAVVCLHRRLELHDAAARSTALDESLRHLERHDVLSPRSRLLHAGVDTDELLALAQHACFVERSALPEPLAGHHHVDPLWHTLLMACMQIAGATESTGALVRVGRVRQRILRTTTAAIGSRRGKRCIQGLAGIALLAQLGILGPAIYERVERSGALDAEIDLLEEQIRHLRRYAAQLASDPETTILRLRDVQSLQLAVAATRRPVLQHLADVLARTPSIELSALAWWRRLGGARTHATAGRDAIETGPFAPPVRPSAERGPLVGWQVRFEGQLAGEPKLAERQAIVRAFVARLEEHPAIRQVQLLSSPVDAWRWAPMAPVRASDSANDFVVEALLVAIDA